MNGTSYLELLEALAPEVIVVLSALAVLIIDGAALRDVSARTRILVCSLVSAVGCSVALASALALPVSGNFLSGMLVVDAQTQFVKAGILFLVILTCWLGADNPCTTHTAEYYLLVLLAGAGMLLLCSSDDLVMIFLALELTSICLYLLAAFDTRSAASAEAGLKYFLFGGTAAASTLFGMSLLYGLTGSTNLSEIAQALQNPRLAAAPLFLLASVMTVAGFGFKVAVAPFHLWAPDVYQGAPIASAALIASGSKVAGFFIIAKVVLLTSVVPGAVPVSLGHAWLGLIAVLAGASMLAGNLAAIVQTSVRRLLAYSAIAHGGYMLLGLMAQDARGLNSILYYALTYGLTVIGAFGIVSLVLRQTGGDRLSDFAGLSRRSPVLAFSMTIFMLSLAGVPPLAGFFSKFYVFAASLDSTRRLASLWLVALGVGMSAVSLYYYLQVLKQIYIGNPSRAEPSGTPFLTQIVIAAAAVLVILLGCAPDLLLSRLSVSTFLSAH